MKESVHVCARVKDYGLIFKKPASMRKRRYAEEAERERERVCVCVREKEGERKRKREHVCVCKSERLWLD